MKSLLKLFPRIASVCLCAVMAGTGFAQAPEPAAAPNVNGVLGQMKLKGSRIAELDASHVKIAVDLTITPGRSATLEDLRLLSLRLNGLPVFAEPILQPIELAQGKETALPPIYVTTQFRDLNSVAPIREMIEKQSVHVQGQIIAGVKAGFLEKLAMHTMHPRVSLTIAQDVPVEVQVSPLQRQAALAALAVIDFGLERTAGVRKNLPGMQSPWLRDLETQASKSIVEVENTYALKEHDTSYNVTQDQLGFRLTSGKIVTTAEARAPWEYDADFQARLKSGRVKLVKDGSDLMLFSPSSRSAAGIADTVSISHKDFTVTEVGSSEKDALILRKPSDPEDEPGHKQSGVKSVSVHRRASPGVMTVLTPVAAGGEGLTLAPAAVAQQESWEKVALFRLLSDASSGKDSIEVIQIAARREGQAIHLDRPVDSSFFGSPIITPEGVIGIVQDQEAGSLLPPTL